MPVKFTPLYCSKLFWVLQVLLPSFGLRLRVTEHATEVEMVGLMFRDKKRVVLVRNKTRKSK